MQRLEFAVVAAFLFLFSAPHGFAAEAPAAPVAAVTLAIDKPLHFDGADGKDVTLAPGDYLVLPEQAGLRLIDVTDAVFLVKATAATHEQKIEQSQALVVAVGDDERHIVLLQPDGQRLDAAGTVSGIHSRGLGSPLVSNTALQNAVTMNAASNTAATLAPTATVAPTATLATAPVATVTAAPASTGVQAIQKGDLRQGLPRTLTPTWSLRPDETPSIGGNAEVLLFVHGMDSRAEEADDITHALFNALATRPPTTGAASTAIMIAANFHTVNFSSSEMCAHPDAVGPNGQKIAVVPFDMVNGVKTPLYFVPDLLPFYPGMPQALLDAPSPRGPFNIPAAQNLGANEGRMRSDLRSVAAAAQPLAPPPNGSLSQAAYKFALNDPVMGRAFADLAVTGRRSFAAFKQALPQDAFCQTLSTAPVPAPYPQMNPNDILNGCRAALDRAYRVANYLRTGQRGDTPALKAAKVAERNALGWIAVSGEDDQPHRPVNVPSSDYPQFDLPVVVATPVRDWPNPTPQQRQNTTVWTRYTIAQSGTLPNGRNLVIISMDLPTSGYADNLDYRVVSPLAAIGTPRGPAIDFAFSGATPLLDFIETFIVNFAVALDQQVPFKNNIKAVMGGSLGGNMTLRLGRRPNVPWLPKFVVWSPASIWDSLGWGADLTKHLAVRTAWEGADKAMNQPNPGDRAAFFGSWDKPILPGVVPAQSDTWTSDYYACKYSSVAAARLDRQETYDARFYAWHWRLGGEQLLYSHQSPDPAHVPAPYLSNTKPMLLACGVEDHVAWNNICPATQNTAPKMVTTPGRALFLQQTGHSLDNERPSLWSQQIIGFLGL